MLPAPAERPGQSPFCESLPNMQKAWDNTSISKIKECPRKYYYEIILGYRPHTSAPPLVFGGLWHKGLERFDTLVARGHDRDTALRSAIRLVLTETHWTEVVQAVDQETGEVKDVTINRFWHGDSNRTRQTLVRSLVWYVDHFSQDIIQTYVMPDGTPATELSFRFELPLTSPDGEPYIYCGHLDKVAWMSEELWVVERKHTKNTLGGSYFQQWSPNSQVSGYSVAGKIVLERPIVGVIIDAAQVAVTFTRFGRSFANRAPDTLEDWVNNTLHWIEQARHYAETGFWPMNEESCHKYSGCQFRDVCSKSPSVRQQWLDGNFIRRPWNPLDNRGDVD